MAEETQPLEHIDDTLNAEDIDMLRAVLQDEHTRGIMPVSVYTQTELAAEE